MTLMYSSGLAKLDVSYWKLMLPTAGIQTMFSLTDILRHILMRKHKMIDLLKICSLYVIYPIEEQYAMCCRAIYG